MTTHALIIFGFLMNAQMDPGLIDPPAQSSCTSCIYKEDTSNYWTASIYFRSPENGTFRRVPQMANGRLNGTLLEQDGGLTIYYMRPFSGTNKKTTVFKAVSALARIHFFFGREKEKEKKKERKPRKK